MLVTDSNGQLIETYQLKNNSQFLGSKYWVFYPSINDQYGNILYVFENQICLFNLTMNITKDCMAIYNGSLLSNIVPFTYLSIDQSGRLVVFD